MEDDKLIYEMFIKSYKYSPPKCVNEITHLWGYDDFLDNT